MEQTNVFEKRNGKKERDKSGKYSEGEVGLN